MQIAKIEDGAASPSQFVSIGISENTEMGKKNPSVYPATKISKYKVKGADAMKISEEIISKINDLKKTLILADVQVEVTINYVESASHKLSELPMNLRVTILAVTILVMLAMG